MKARIALANKSRRPVAAGLVLVSTLCWGQKPVIYPGGVVNAASFVPKGQPTHAVGQYKQRHRAVWPEMREALERAGWHNYSLFLREDGLLVGYLETPDFERARAAMAASEVNRRWQTAMADLFEGPPGLPADQQMRPLPEVFHLA